MQCPCGLVGVLAIVTLAALSQAYEEELEDIFDARPSLKVSLIKNKKVNKFLQPQRTNTDHPDFRVVNKSVHN